MANVRSNIGDSSTMEDTKSFLVFGKFSCTTTKHFVSNALFEVAEKNVAVPCIFSIHFSMFGSQLKTPSLLFDVLHENQNKNPPGGLNLPSKVNEYDLLTPLS